jgi:hypothetical protein
MLESFEVQFLPQLALEQQKIDTGLKNLVHPKFDQYSLVLVGRSG